MAGGRFQVDLSLKGKSGSVTFCLGFRFLKKSKNWGITCQLSAFTYLGKRESDDKKGKNKIMSWNGTHYFPVVRMGYILL